MALIKISQVRRGNISVTIFHLQDRISLGNYKELEVAAKEAYENGMRNLVIDLSNSDALTSIGIRALVVIHKMLVTEDGKHLKLAGVAPSIQEILDVAGITQFIEIHDTVDEALSAFH